MDNIKYYIIKKFITETIPENNEFGMISMFLMKRKTKIRYSIILKLLGFHNYNVKKWLSLFPFYYQSDEVFNGDNNIMREKIIHISKQTILLFNKIRTSHQPMFHMMMLKMYIYNFFDYFDKVMETDKLFLLKKMYEDYFKYEKELEVENADEDLKQSIKANQDFLLKQIARLSKKDFKLNMELNKSYLMVFKEELAHNNFSKLLESLDFIKNLLKSLVPNSIRIHNELDEKIDTDLYKQIFETGSYDDTMIFNLIMYLFDHLEKFQCPADDAANLEWKLDISQKLQTETYFEIIPVFIEGYIEKLKKIYRDVNNLKELLSKHS